MDVIDIWRHILAVEPLIAAAYVTLRRDISSLVGVSEKYDYMIAIGYTVTFSRWFMGARAQTCGQITWMRKGLKHRLDGPAIDMECGCVAYYKKDTETKFVHTSCSYR